MTLLVVYLAIALGFSFLCSIAEATLLSISTAYISTQERDNKPWAALLQNLKRDIDAPLAAILSLNTIAHTVGAAGVGAQAASVFGSGYVGIVSAVLTLLILIFSEIIPKTLGTAYWRQLAPGVAYALKYLVLILAPLVWLSNKLTSRIGVHPTLEGFSRDEFSAMAALGEKEGELKENEAALLQNVLALKNKKVADVMTPGTVIFSLPEEHTVEYFVNKHDQASFSRIPVYADSPDNITGFVMRNELLIAKARGNSSKTLSEYRRELSATPDKLPLIQCFENFLQDRSHIKYVVDEYGSLKGLVTLEDILEELMGQEIIDETDRAADMQKLARKRWRKKASQMGLNIDKKNITEKDQ